jgi:hypothetical protein
MKLFQFFQFLCTFLSSWIRIQPDKINADPDPNTGNLLYMIIYFIPVWNVCTVHLLIYESKLRENMATDLFTLE